MSPLGIAKAENKTLFTNIKPFLLPAYIVLSAVFIVYIAYSYFQGVVYNTGLNQGAEAGQQQGYEQAIIDLMNQAGSQCEAVALTAGETQVDVINVACLQQAPVQENISPEVIGEDQQ